MKKLLISSLLLTGATVNAIQPFTTQMAYLVKKFSLERPVRVQLRKALPEETAWNVQSENGFVIHDPATNTSKILQETTLKVTHDGESFYLNDAPETQVFIAPLKGLISVDSIRYDGFFALAYYEDNAYLVNHVGLEDYLASVLPYESVPEWPGDAQKALCIACRSYTIGKLIERKDWPYPFDLYCTTMDQVYGGHENGVDLRQFVKETEGMILTIDKEPVLTMYSAVCGGVTPAEMDSHFFKKAPYLKRDYPCNHCDQQKYYRWETTCSFSDLEKKLVEVVPDLGPLEDIIISTYDDAGIAKEVMLLGSDGTWHTVKAKEVRMRFPNIRSYCCTFSTKDR